MLKKILGTIGTRYLIAILNLALIFINAKTLGVKGLGLAGIILASVNIVVMFNGILSGNTIVYFMNRYSMRTIFIPAYLWTLLGSAIACLCMKALGLIPDGYVQAVYLLSVLMSWVAANSRFLLGKDRITGFNITFMLQGGMLFFVLLYFYYIRQEQEVGAYIWGLYITNGTAFLFSLFLLLPGLFASNPQHSTDGKSYTVVLKEMFAYGLWGSVDNMAEILTTRLNYFLIQRFGGLGNVGLLDAGTKISESVWHISRSISFIEYGSVAQTNEAARQKRITLQLFKLTFCAVTLATVCVLLIPEWVYTDYLFSSQFKGIRQVIAGLSVGIVALGCNSILSHYFIGSGQIRYSAGSSAIGLLSLLIAGYGLIPFQGVVGAAVSSSIAFCMMLAFSMGVFCKKTHTHLSEFLPNAADISFLKEYLRQKRTKH